MKTQNASKIQMMDSEMSTLLPFVRNPIVFNPDDED